MEKQEKLTTSEIKDLIKNEGHILKFRGTAPEGFVLVHEKTLEQLKNMDDWIEWKMNRKTIHEMNKINFDNT